MAFTRLGIVFIVSVIAFDLLVSLYVYSNVVMGPAYLVVRLLALNGFFMLSVAAMLSAFLREINSNLGRSYLQVHHFFAAVGLSLVTVHPVLFAVQTLDPMIFLPNFSSPYYFFAWGGIVALSLVYVALFAALLMKRIGKYFRVFHPLIYLALAFAVVHANLLGVDFGSMAVKVTYDLLFSAVLGTLVLKRYKMQRLKTSRSRSSQGNKQPVKP